MKHIASFNRVDWGGTWWDIRLEGQVHVQLKKRTISKEFLGSLSTCETIFFPLQHPCLAGEMCSVRKHHSPNCFSHIPGPLGTWEKSLMLSRHNFQFFWLFLHFKTVCVCVFTHAMTWDIHLNNRGQPTQRSLVSPQSTWVPGTELKLSKGIVSCEMTTLLALNTHFNKYCYLELFSSMSIRGKALPSGHKKHTLTANALALTPTGWWLPFQSKLWVQEWMAILGITHSIAYLGHSVEAAGPSVYDKAQDTQLR